MINKALEYLKAGASVIPAGNDKIPLIPWKEYQNRLPTEIEIKDWWKKYPNANIGIVTGKISNLIVVDVERGGSISQFPETDTVETGGGGWHLYYSYIPFENKTRIFPLTDIRGDGGYVVAPPSIHKSGNKYKLIKHIGKKRFPIELFEGKIKSEWKEKIISPLSVGSRNTDFTSIIGGLLNKFSQSEWESIVWKLTKDQNTIQSLPLNEAELRIIFDSIAKKESKKRNTGGEIKDIVTEATDEEIRVKIELSNSIVCFKVTNFFGNIMEASVITWIEKPSGLSYDMPFYLKLKSDSNKEQWVRILGKAFDKKDDKELYPWTILVSKASKEIERCIKEKVQDFMSHSIEARQVEWMLEPFIQTGQINTFFGLGSSGKTIMSLYFSYILAQRGINSMIIDYENDIYSWKDKLNKLAGNKQENFIYYDSEQIPLAEQIDKLKEVIRRRNIQLVIVDSASMASGDSTTDEKAAIKLVGALKLLKTTVILIAHQRKNDGDKTPIGSIQYENQSRNVWNFKKETDELDYKILHIACTHTKANNTYLRNKPQCFKINYEDDSIGVSEESPSVAFESKLNVSDRIKNLLFETPNLEYGEIMEYLDISKDSATAALTRGKKRGIFQNDEGKWSLFGGL